MDRQRSDQAASFISRLNLRRVQQQPNSTDQAVSTRLKDHPKKQANPQHHLTSTLESYPHQVVSNEGKSELKRNPFNGNPYSQNYYKLLEHRMCLPVWDYREKFMRLLDANQFITLVGETGSGKTTQIPQWCVDYLKERSNDFTNLMVGCTQPRRVAAMSVAKRVSEEMDVTLGSHVGYSVRFDECVSKRTILKYLTDGMLLHALVNSPFLDNYGIIILDEAHERTLSTDVLMGLLKGIAKNRPDIKIVIMSATLESTKFQKYFNGPIMNVPGRTFPVDIIYTSQTPDNYLGLAIDRVMEIHTSEKIKGDILVFLTGQDEIEDACDLLKKRIEQAGDSIGTLECIPLYSILPPKHQQRIFNPAPPNKPNGAIGRKCIVSTNIAETSLTIDGIVFVVDSGFVKQNIYNSRTGVETLRASAISKHSAIQRAGRAGRTCSGKCYRLYSENTFNHVMKDHTCPEILRSNLGTAVLKLKKLGVDDVIKFEFIDPPEQEALIHAQQDLYYLGALDKNCKLTKHGSLMAEFPLSPEMSKVLITSADLNCSNEILTIVSMLSAPQCFVRPNKKKKTMRQKADTIISQFAHSEGDHLSLLNVYNAYKQNNEDPDWCYDHYINCRNMKNAVDVRTQLSRLMDKFELNRSSNTSKSPKYYENIKKALISGFSMQVAYRYRDGIFTLPKCQGINYKTVKDQPVAFDALTFVKDEPDFVIYNELVSNAGNSGKCFIRIVTGIKAKWLLSMAPRYYDSSTLPEGHVNEEFVNLQKLKTSHQLDPNSEECKLN